MTVARVFRNRRLRRRCADLRALNYADVSPLRDWLPGPFRKEPPDIVLEGLWFGLFNPCPDGRRPVADIYVAGSARFDPDPHDNSWAVGAEWRPHSRAANSRVLADIYRIAYRRGARVAKHQQCLGNNAEYPLCLGYGAFAVRELMERVEPSRLLGRSASLGVAVGFDIGDFALLRQLTQSVLKPIDPGRRNVRSSRCSKGYARPITGASSEPFSNWAASAIARESPCRNCCGSRLPRSSGYGSLSAAALLRIKDMKNDPDEHVASWSEIALRNIRLRDQAGE